MLKLGILLADVHCFRKNKKFGYLGTDFEYEIDPDYEKAREFSENGLAVVCMDGKFGVIDRYGNQVVKDRI